MLPVIISDEKQPQSIAGVIGGLNSGCTLDTKEMFLESALFDKSAVAYNGRSLNILSDARYRFERGIDPNSVDFGVEEMTKLVLEICGGEVSEVVSAGSFNYKKKNIHYRPEKLLKIGGIKMNISSWRRPAPNSVPWDSKAAGLYMICTLSKHEAESKGFEDSLMLDHEGNIAEATGANIFFKDNSGSLHTPVPDSFLDGITRRCIIDIAKSKGIKIIERKIKPEEISGFVGCFLTGTAAEVTPVSQIDKFNFKVCDLIKNLSESYQNFVRKKVAA